MITFIQFVESIQNKDRMQSFINQLLPNIDVDKGRYANIIDFDKDKLEEKLKTWNVFQNLSAEDKKNIIAMLDMKGKKIIDLFNAIEVSASSANKTSEIKT